MEAYSVKREQRERERKSNSSPDDCYGFIFTIVNGLLLSDRSGVNEVCKFVCIAVA